jgi:acyl-CoA synthetase (AMP-forming)/AMP-acid ligase II
MTKFPEATVLSLIATGLDEAPAIAAPGQAALSYAALRTLAGQTIDRLNQLGIGRNDRIAIVLANGPQMAAAFVAIAAGATTAPLNPSYRADEFEFYLADLEAKALLVERGAETPARAVAARLGVPILELCPDPAAGAGAFTIEPMVEAPADALLDVVARADAPGAAEPDDIALILHTSGTTSRPKMVPLTQRNITASAGHISRTLQLSPADTCLNIMPLFHIHGLMAAVLSSLAAGAQVCCTPGFSPLKFFAWLDQVRPTWYTAVPTMHQAILTRADRNLEVLERSRLRLIRSSSASLPSAVMAQLEERFRAPVIESYGMTEASHQMASNPLPPLDRHPGSVGLAAGPEIGVMDPEGLLLPPDAIGEVVIRGPNVTTGYAANPTANATAFTSGWFRTGDQGFLDQHGYLRLTGRLKELINRGGEKISPLEVDEILMAHPAVQQVVTFAMPHDALGEEVAAAVVLREGQSVTERELKAFAAERLADFKLPRRIVFLDEIPKGATGKLQRIGLAAKLGLGTPAAS